jgi:hypothetical protein
MKNRLSQSGSVHAVAIILLVLALLGTLGFVFYQNFIAKKTDTPVTVSTDQPVVNTETARIAFNSDIYELDYSKSWAVTTTKTGDGSTTTFANVDKTINVTFAVSSGGLGGACDTNDGLKVRYHNVHPAFSDKLTGVPLYLVEAMSDYPGGGYNYVIGLVPDGGETHAAIGDSHCTIGYVGVASSVVTDNATDAVTKPTILANISFPKLPDAKDRKVKDMQTIKDILSTDDYKAAVKILESARKK